MKKVIFLLVACAVSLAQCDVWQKPLIEPIVKETKKADEIEKIMVTKYPYPNTFSRDNETLAVLKNGGAVVWENECALEIFGVTSGGEMRKLTAPEYMVDGFDPAALDDGKYPVTVRLNGAPEVTTSFDIAIVYLDENYHEVKIAAGISHGTLVPFPSGAKEGALVTVYIAPDEGYGYEENSFSIYPPPPLPQVSFTKNIDETFTFTMPGSDVTITAKFLEAAVKLEITGQSASYYETLKAAFDELGSADTATITLLWDVEEQNITVSGNVTLTAAPGAPKIISRGGSPTGSLFTVGSGASLTLDAGYSLGLTLDGKNIPVDSPLVTVSGGALTVGGRVTLRNNNNSNNPGYSYGGGVYVTDGIFNMSGGTISNNTAVSGGGSGVYASGSTFNMSGGKISGNEAANDSGGGVYVTGGSTFNMSSGEISGNTAVQGGGGVYVTYGNNNTFTMSGNAVVKQDVYLASGRKITVSGALTPPEGEYSAEIRLAAPAEGAVVLDGVGSDAGKFKLNNIAVLAHNSAANNYKVYSALSAAIINDADAGTEIDPTVVYVVADKVPVTGNAAVSNKHIKLTVLGDGAKTVERASSFTNGSLFSVNAGASLVLDAGNGSLALDGKNIAAAAPLVTVSGGTLTMGERVALRNNNNNAPNNTVNGGGVLIDGGIFEMTGGTISGNTVSQNSGGVRVNGGSFTMSGGTISGNTANYDSGGVRVNGGSFKMTGGMISSNTAKSNGGGVLVYNGATFTMEGGTISGNKSTGSTAESRGGGVLLHTGSTFTMTGGEISGNTIAGNGTGGGIHVGGTFTMNGGAVVKQDVYLSSGKIITVSGALTPPEGETYSAEIKLENASGNTVVLDGAGYSLTESDIAKFTLLNSNVDLSYQDGKGVAVTLEWIISSVLPGTTMTIFVQDNITVASSINVQGNVTLTVVDGLEATIERGSSTGSLFTVQSGASLTLDAGNGSLTLDGKNIPANAPLVTVSGGTLTMGDGVALKNSNNNTQNGGGVIVNSGGTFVMTGGEISDNTLSTGSAAHGGGVILDGNSTFTMSGGKISGNTAASASATAHGGGVMIHGGCVFAMSGGAVISSNKALGPNGLGGGVFINYGGTFTMSGAAVIIGNTATGSGGGVYINGDGVLTMTGGFIYGSSEGPPLSNTAPSSAAVNGRDDTVTSFP
jgi:hypothetical protein